MSTIHSPAINVSTNKASAHFYNMDFYDKVPFDKGVDSLPGHETRQDISSYSETLLLASAEELAEGSVALSIAQDRRGTMHMKNLAQAKRVYTSMDEVSTHLAKTSDSEAMKPYLQLLYANSGNTGNAVVSDKDLVGSMINIADTMKENYESVIANITKQYAEFFKAFSDTVTQMGQYIENNKSDTNKMIVKFDRIIGLLDPVKTTFEKIAIFGPASKADADYWAAKIGLPDSCVKPSGSGYSLFMDMSPITEIIKSCKDGGNNIRGNNLSNYDFQIWQSGHTIQKESLQGKVQTTAELFSRAVSQTDNVIKFMSSMINALMEAAKQTIQSI